MDKTLRTHLIFHLDDINTDSICKLKDRQMYRIQTTLLTPQSSFQTHYNTVNKDKFKNKTEKIQSPR